MPHPLHHPIDIDSSIDMAPPLCTGSGDHAISHSSTSIFPVEEDLVSDPFLEYINSILMDDKMEDSNWPVQQNCLNDYQHIVNGFYEILGEGSPSLLSGSYSDQITGRNVCCGAEGENGWIQGVLGSDPCTAISSFQQQLEEDGHPLNSLAYNTTLQDGHGTGTVIILSGEDGVKFGLNAHFQYGTEQHDVQPHMHGGLQNTSVPNRRKCSREEAVAVLGCYRNGRQPVIDGQPYAESSADAEDAVSFVRNKDLKAEVHAQLYEEWPLRWKEPSSAGASRPSGKFKVDAALLNPVDLQALLVSCAKAVGDGNVKMANKILQDVQQHGASPYGSGLQRLAHYFSQALVARIGGMGSSLYAAMSNDAKLLSTVMMLKGYKMVFEVCPYVKLSHYFANQCILKAAEGASRLHIVDYGIFYGFQWPCLISALAHRKGGPPFLRITGIELPANSAVKPAKMVEVTGRRLAEYATTYNVPFEYRAIAASNWEDVDPDSLHVRQGEVLVLNSFNRLRHVLDESVVASSPRDQLLRRMRSLNPDLLVTGFMNSAHGSPPFFAYRFRMALYYYASKFDMLHTILSSDSPERLLIERELFGRDILNAVACEGVERVERPDTYKQWQVRLQRAGFQQLPIIPTVLSTSQAVLKSFYHKDFDVQDDSNMWMLLGWKGRAVESLSAWKPLSS